MRYIPQIIYEYEYRYVILYIKIVSKDVKEKCDIYPDYNTHRIYIYIIYSRNIYTRGEYLSRYVIHDVYTNTVLW